MGRCEGTKDSRKSKLPFLLSQHCHESSGTVLQRALQLSSCFNVNRDEMSDLY